jgi:hypothetical protein
MSLTTVVMQWAAPAVGLGSIWVAHRRRVRADELLRVSRLGLRVILATVVFTIVLEVLRSAAGRRPRYAMVYQALADKLSVRLLLPTACISCSDSPCTYGTGALEQYDPQLTGAPVGSARPHRAGRTMQEREQGLVPS